MSTKNRKNLKRPSVAKRSSNSADPPGPPKDSAKTPKDEAKEFIIRVPKVRNNRHIMRFNDNLKVEFAEWQSVKMSRENNKHLVVVEEDKKPKWGGGTEYNWRSSCRSRLKNGGVFEKYKPEAQPWLLQVNGKVGKKFKGIRTGEVGANAAYYVFTHAPDGRFNAYPVHEWYTFQAIERYKTLTSEEVEQEFGRREKSLNYFNLMMRRRYQPDDEEQDTDSAKLLKAADDATRGLKITDEVEWMASGDDSESDAENGETKEKEKKKDDDIVDATDGKKAKAKGKKKLNMKTFFEDSDDGDEDSRERDYISNSSDDEPDPEAKVIKEMKGVSEEEALRKLLNSDDDDDENSENEKDEAQEENPEDEAAKKRMAGTSSNVSSGESSTESSSDTSSDPEKDLGNGPPRKRVTFNKKEKRIAAKKSTKRKVPVGRAPPTSSTPKPMKAPMKPPQKKDTSIPLELSNSLRKINQHGVNEEEVIRYLKRKPLTTTELLSKFRNKATTDSRIRLVETITKILKKINPEKTTIQGKLYFSIK